MIVLAALLFGVVGFALAGALHLSILFAVLALGLLIVCPSEQRDAFERNQTRRLR